MTPVSSSPQRYRMPCCAHASLQCCPSSSTSRGFGRAVFTVAPTAFITSVRSNAGEKRQFARVAMRLGRSTHVLSAGSDGCVCACAACMCVSACVAANVVSADEYAINVTDSVYTNAIASLSLQVRSALSLRSNRSTHE